LAHDFATPLAESLARRIAGFEVVTALGADATKARLASLVNGAEDIALIVTAGHGLGFPYGHSLQPARQGAIVCQDFAGFSKRGPVAPEHYFAADDIRDTACVHGLITFHLGSYSAGTPANGAFPRIPGSPLEHGAPRSFLSHLSQRLTGHRRGSALAVVGYTGKVWHTDPKSLGFGRSIQSFEDAFDRLLHGMSVGYAMEPFGECYAELATDLAEELEISRYGATVDDAIVSVLWTGRNNCRNLTVVGDPAVRLAVPLAPVEEDEPGASCTALS